MTTDKLEDLRRHIADIRRVNGTWVKIHIVDAEELAAAAWPPRPGIQWRARVKAQSRRVE